VSGSGNLRIRVLDEDGNEMPDSGRSVPAGAIGNAEFASGAPSSLISTRTVARNTR
jgi:hypothetical protein